MARRELVGGGSGEKFLLKVPVVGIYRGMRTGLYEDSPLIDLEIDGVVKTYYGKKALKSKLGGAEEGETLEIIFTGLKPNKAKPGQTYNDFTVNVIDEDDEPEAPKTAPKPAPKSAKTPPPPKKAAPKQTQPDDDEVPF
jgi:hypothetical protein